MGGLDWLCGAHAVSEFARLANEVRMGWVRGIYRVSDESLDVNMNVVRSYAREANSSISLGELPEESVQES